jgi:hypothetical protein
MGINPEEWFGKTAQDPNRVRTMWVDVKDPGLRQVLGIPEGGMSLHDYLGIQPDAGQPSEPINSPGFVSSVKRGTYNTGANIMNAGQLASQALSIPQFAEYFSRKAQDWKAAGEKYPRAVPGIENIQDAGDFATWAIETLGEQVPMLASIAIPGGVAGLGARALGAGATAAKVAGYGTAFASDAAQMTGESVEIAQQNNADITDLRVIGSGLGKAMLDFIPFWTLAKTTGIAKPFESAIIRKLSEAGYLKRAAGNAAVLIASEVPTETMQEIINVELDNFFTGYDGPITDDQKSQLYNAAAGASLFGVFGLYAPARTPPPPGITEVDENLQQAETPKQLTFQPPTDFEFKNVPSGADPQAPSGFDFRNLYDSKTGAIKTSANDYMRIVKEQMQVKYDPLSDTVAAPPSTANYTTIMPGWQQRGDAWYLDAPTNNVDAGKAQIMATPQGFEAFDVYGNQLGVYPDLGTAQQGATAAVYAKSQSYVFDEYGMHVAAQPDGHSQMAMSIPQPATPIEQAVVQIEQIKPKKQPSGLRNPEGEAAVSMIVNDVDMMKLLDARNEFINNKDNYRTTDGEMKKAAAKTLAAMDERLARLANLKGVNNPNEGETVSVVGQKIDETLGEITNAAQATKEAPSYPNLTVFEAKQYDSLAEKDMFDGLSTREQEIFDRLDAKRRTGVDLNTRVGIYETVPADQADQFSAEEATLLKKARKNIRYSKATRAIMKMRNVQPAVLGQRFAIEKPGWRIIPKENPEKVRAINVEQNAIIFQRDSGYEAVKQHEGVSYSLGYYSTAEEAADVATGVMQSPVVAEAYKAVEKVWRSFMIRPKLVIMSVAEIMSSKDMTHEEKRMLIRSRGVFSAGKPGTVYINIDAHNHPAEAVSTLVHEMLAHFGLRATLSTENWARVMWAYAQYNREALKQIEREGKSPSGYKYRKEGETGLADVFSADEAIAYIAEKKYSGNELEPFEQSFLDRVVTTVRAWIRNLIRILPDAWQDAAQKALPFNEKDVVKLLRDTAAALRSEPTRPINTMLGRGNEIMPAKASAAVLERSVDSFSSVWTAKAAGLFLQPLQFAERYNVPGVADYIKFVQRWAARKASLQNAPVTLLEDWQTYNKTKSNRLAEALLSITAASDKKIKMTGEGLTQEEREAMLKEHGIVDEHGLRIYAQIRESFRSLLDQLENAIIKQTIRKEVDDSAYADKLYKAYLSDRTAAANGKNEKAFQDMLTQELKNLELGGRLLKVHAQINELRKRDYFPYMRFGRYAIWVRAKNTVVLDGTKYYGPRDNAKGQMVHFETYESYRDMQDALKSFPKEYDQKNFDIGTGLVSDQEFTFLGMPPALYEVLQEHLDLTEAQKELLKEIYFTKSPGQRFLKSMVHRKGLKGFSQDATRVYASYFLNAAGHIARIENGQDMDAALSEVRKYADEAGINAGTIRDYWGQHYKYIMNPENDWAGLRAVGFMWYLGFNVKSAMVNLTQVPMVAFPYLSARFNEAKALAALSSSYKEAFRILRSKDIPKSALEKSIQRGIEEGFLDESLATVLAGFSESSVLQRIAPETDAQRRLNQIAWAGSWMFRHVESINRYVTFIAARRLALEANGGNEEQAFAEAKEAVQSAMFEYAKWNRAPFARGKKSVFFLFWSYMQGLAYLMGGGKGKKTALRVWVMMLLAAGYQGIPFADNILDLFDWTSRELKEALGWEDPYTDARTELRRAAQNITDNPEMLLHGWSKHYGLGPMHLLSLAGVPVPEVDLSGSLGVGRWLPGTDKLTATERDPDKKFGRTLVDVLGPVAGVGYGFFRAMVDQNPDTWKVWERAMPSALKAASQAARRTSVGAEEFRGGGAIATWDPNNPEDRMGLALNMLGFQQTKISEAYEVIGAKENLRRYWTMRQAMVMENWAFAKRSQDPELMADANQAKLDFNEEVPDPMLRLTSEKIRRSMKARQKKINQREMGLPSEKGYRRLYQEIDQIYGVQR